VYDHQAFIQEFSPGGVNLTQWSHTGEAQRAERGGEVLGEGVTSSPPHQLGRLGEHCKQIAGHKPAGSVPPKRKFSLPTMSRFTLPAAWYLRFSL